MTATCTSQGVDTTSSAIEGLVSIVVPVYNGARFLEEALESCLRQTYAKIEVLVVDDYSHDNSWEIAQRVARRDARIRLIRHATNGGVSRAFNSGFAAARGEYFTRLAHDDRFVPHAIATLVESLRRDPTIGLVYCDMATIDSQGRQTGVWETRPPETVLRGGDHLGVCAMWRRMVWDAVGSFDSAYDTAEDYEYWLRVAKRFRLQKLEGHRLLEYRMHDNMNTLVQHDRQVVATARAEARHTSDRRRARQILGQMYFETAWNSRASQPTLALKRLLQAIRHQPLSPRNYRCLGGLLLDTTFPKRRQKSALAASVASNQSDLRMRMESP